MKNQKLSLFSRSKEILREEGINILFKKSLSYLNDKLNFCIFPYALLKMKYLNKKNLSLDDLINISLHKFSGLIRPIQIQDEILNLLRILNKIKPKVILEIGTARGGNLFLLSRVASEDATIVSIDLPEGKFGGGYPKWKIPLYKSFRLPSQKLQLIRADSHSQETLEKIKKALDGKKVDFLFIDGDHTYEGIKKDFEIYSPLVKEDGIIAFHDIVLGPKENVGGVPEFWKEVKDKYTNKEIVKDWNQGGYGIGVLKVGK